MNQQTDWITIQWSKLYFRVILVEILLETVTKSLIFCKHLKQLMDVILTLFAKRPYLQYSVSQSHFCTKRVGFSRRFSHAFFTPHLSCCVTTFYQFWVEMFYLIYIIYILFISTFLNLPIVGPVLDPTPVWIYK